MKRWKKTLFLVASLLTGGVVWLLLRYRRDLKKAYSKLNSYEVKTIDTSFGKMSYTESGAAEGTPVMLVHGIFGGYDQGMEALDALLPDEYRKIALSRFGYPGTAPHKEPTPLRQAAQLTELMDALAVEEAYVIGTSAGGPATYQLTLNFPERVKGMILLSADAPFEQKTRQQLAQERTGPPAFLLNDPVMWLTLTYFGRFLQEMFGGENSAKNLLATFLPVRERKQGIVIDSEVTNRDLMLHYEDYPVEEIGVPVLVLGAKDDPMIEYRHVEKLIQRLDPEVAIYETGGHLLEGSNSAERLLEFVQKHTV